MTKHVFSVNALRDKINSQKPTYKRLSEFINEDENVLSRNELVGLKAVLVKEHTDIVKKIDKYINILTKSKS